MTAMAFGFIGGYLAGSRASARANRMHAMANSMSVASQVADVDELDERLDRLGIVVAAMWSLLEDAGYTDEALEARIAELTRPAEEMALLSCPECGSGVRPGAGTCQICGTAVGEADPLHDLADPM